MSNIFDALQRSAAEKSGVEFLKVPSEAAELVEAAERKAGGFGDFPSVQASAVHNGRFALLTHSESLGAEKFRFLSVRLRQLRQSRPLKKVLITSTIAEEGKSLVAANLAATLARRHQKVLLLDGDLRRPVLEKQFGLQKLAGLAEWLEGDRRPVSNIYHLDDLGFWFMPAGSPPMNPLELMQSGRLSELMDQLAVWFEWIVIDSPPLLPLADTTVWARVADGLLLVAREGKTEKRQLERGLQVVRKTELIGVVWNGCTTPDHKYYYQRYQHVDSKGEISTEKRKLA